MDFRFFPSAGGMAVSFRRASVRKLHERALACRASTELRVARELNVSSRMKIADLMTPNPEFCTPDDSIVDAARIMARRDVGIVPIVESMETRRAIGCITDRDIVVRVIAVGKDPNLISLRDVMTHDLITCSPDDDVDEVRQLMEQRQVRRVIAIDEYASLAGVVALADLAREVEREKVGATMESISQPA
jgi:CBS domain-containing protein